jgi:hypothetical protein
MPPRGSTFDENGASWARASRPPGALRDPEIPGPLWRADETFVFPGFSEEHSPNA